MESTKLVKEFCEDKFSQFQEWLQTEYDIESTDAEVILGSLDQYHRVAAIPGEAIDRKFLFVAINPSNGNIFTQNEGVVFLAKDNLFVPTLLFYLDLVCHHKGHTSDEAEAIRLMMDRVLAWQEAHPGQCKLPDISGEKEKRALLQPNEIVQHHPV